uniref:Transmembrane protein n=2 Tax=Ditylum brightwellii TaxID=49249 RepID=A0A7S4VGZ2_9STRA
MKRRRLRRPTHATDSNVTETHDEYSSISDIPSSIARLVGSHKRKRSRHHKPTITPSQSESSVSTQQQGQARTNTVCSDREIETTFEDDTGSYGNIFNVVSTRKTGGAVLIKGIELYTDVDYDVAYEVYTKPNSFQSSDTLRDLSTWTLIADGFLVGLEGKLNVGTALPSSEIFSPVTIYPGQTQAFYVTLTTPDLRYVNGSALGITDVGETFVANDELAIQSGVGVGNYPLNAQAKFFSPRVWSGSIYYVTEEEPCPTSDSPSAPPCTNHGSSVVETLFQGATTAYGNMFDIRSLADGLVVKTLEISTTSDLVRADMSVKVFTKPGTHLGFEGVANAWALISEVILERPKEGNTRTIIPLHAFEEVSLNANERQAFYVSLDTADAKYTRANDFREGIKVGDIVASQQGVLEIMAGNAMPSLSFGEWTYAPRIWNGAVHYEILTNDLNCTASNETISNVESTVVWYDMLLFYPRRMNLDDILNDLAEGLPEIMSEQLFADNDGVRVANSTAQIKESQGSCKQIPPGYACIETATKVTLEHNRDIDSGFLEYITLKHANDISNFFKIDQNGFAASFIGAKAIETQVVLQIIGLEGGRKMNDEESAFFEHSFRNFLNEVLLSGRQYHREKTNTTIDGTEEIRGLRILSVEVNRQDINGQQIEGRRRSHLSKTYNTVVYVAMTIRGELHQTLDDLTFKELVDFYVMDQGGRLAKRLIKLGSHSYFSGVSFHATSSDSESINQPITQVPSVAPLPNASDTPTAKQITSSPTPSKTKTSSSQTDLSSAAIISLLALLGAAVLLLIIWISIKCCFGRRKKKTRKVQNRSCSILHVRTGETDTVMSGSAAKDGGSSRLQHISKSTINSGLSNNDCEGSSNDLEISVEDEDEIEQIYRDFIGSQARLSEAMLFCSPNDDLCKRRSIEFAQARSRLLAAQKQFTTKCYSTLDPTGRLASFEAPSNSNDLYKVQRRNSWTDISHVSPEESNYNDKSRRRNSMGDISSYRRSEDEENSELSDLPIEDANQCTNHPSILTEPDPIKLKPLGETSKLRSSQSMSDFSPVREAKVAFSSSLSFISDKLDNSKTCTDTKENVIKKRWHSCSNLVQASLPSINLGGTTKKSFHGESGHCSDNSPEDSKSITDHERTTNDVGSDSKEKKKEGVMEQKRCHSSSDLEQDYSSPNLGNTTHEKSNPDSESAKDNKSTKDIHGAEADVLSDSEKKKCAVDTSSVGNCPDFPSDLSSSAAGSHLSSSASMTSNDVVSDPKEKNEQKKENYNASDPEGTPKCIGSRPAAAFLFSNSHSFRSINTQKIF